MKPIILASASPRRKDLLSLLSVPFTIEVESTDETFDYNCHVESIAMTLATRKSQPIATRNPYAIVIGADTIVVSNNTILGKPANRSDAYKMLHQLSGSIHQVITGVSIHYNNQVETFYSSANVRFYPLTTDEINQYIDTGEPFDKAGSYGIQGLAAKFVHSIKGDYYAVVGLPIAHLYQRLKNYL